MNERLSKKISIYNFIFTIGIVLYHCKTFNTLYSAKPLAFFDAAYELYDLVGYICMGFFFMISAYLFYLGLTTEKSVYKKMQKRLLTLGVPFLAWNVIHLLWEIFYGVVKGNLRLGFWDFIWGFTFQPFDGPLWYMFALLLLMPIAPVLYKLKDHSKVFLGVVIGLFICCNLGKLFMTSDDAVTQWAARFVGYLPIYFLGAYFGLCKSEFVSNEAYSYKLVAPIAAGLSLLIIAYFAFLKQEIPLLNNVLYFVLPITVWLSTYNAMYDKISIGYPLKITFFVYAMHKLLIELLYMSMTKTIGFTSLPPIISFFAHFVVVAAVYFICLATAYIAGKILPSKMYFALSGGRVEGGRAKKQKTS